MATAEELQFIDEILDEIVDKTLSLSLQSTVLISKEIVCEMIDGVVVETDDTAETDVPTEIDHTDVGSQCTEMECTDALTLMNGHNNEPITKEITKGSNCEDSQWTTPETEAVYLALWDKQKLIAEREAEYNAKSKLRRLEKEDKTLEQVIDACLKEYSEMYEAAHTVRLKFELEKAKFTAFIQKMLASSSQNRGGGDADEWMKYEGMGFEDMESEYDKENTVNIKDTNMDQSILQPLQQSLLRKRKRFVTPSREHGA